LKTGILKLLGATLKVCIPPGVVELTGPFPLERTTKCCGIDWNTE